MDILIQNKDFVPVKILDTYKSAIWTERFRQAGDFEIVTSLDALDYLQKGYYLTRSDSDRVMVVEGFQIETSAEDGNYLIVNGRSIESLLDRRIIWDQTIVDSKLDTAVKKLVTENIISPSDENRKIPMIEYKDSTDAKIDAMTINAQFTGDNLYDTICNICETYDIGWKITFQDLTRLVFELYSGTDRSYEQTDNAYVVFSPAFDNIINSNYVESDSKLKNVALIAGEDKAEDRKRVTIGEGSGVDRRELYVDARDLQTESSQLYNALSPNKLADIAIDTSSRKYVTYSGRPGIDKIVWIKIQPGATYDVTRTLEEGQEFGMTLATSSMVPAVGVSIESIANSDDQGDPFTDRGSIVAGENSHYLGIQLFSASDSSATFENSTVDFVIRGLIPEDDYEENLRARGEEKLSECKEIQTFDGEVDYRQMYVYGKDFEMGDICELENEYKMSCVVRVMELVTSDDESGYSVYPTFTSYGGAN